MTLIECNVTGGRQLVLNLLSVHLIRKKSGSVLISYHPTKDIPMTTARYLHERIRFVGKCPMASFFLALLKKKKTNVSLY
jgi:hypothetical protein